MRRVAWTWVAMAVLLAIQTTAVADHHEGVQAPEGEVYFITPSDGERVNGAVTVRFGLRGLGVAPAGVEFPNTGHHHLIIDAEAPAAGQPIPNDAHHRHFGGGQTETTIELPPGRHTLQLVFADSRHVPFAPSIHSERITVEVE